MINFFKNTSSVDQASALYIDILKSLQGDKKRVGDANRQFASLYGESFQKIIYQLSKIKDLQFHTKGYWVVIDGDSYNQRYQVANVKTGDYTRILSETKGNWYFKPRNEYEHSKKIILDALKKLQGVQVEERGSWIWLSGNTFKVLDRIKGIDTGKYKRGFKKVTKEWYFHPRPQN